MSISERIASLSPAKEAVKKVVQEDPKVVKEREEARFANYLSRIPEAIRMQHQLFDELRATGLVGMIKEVAHSIYLEPDHLPLYEKYVEALRAGKSGPDRKITPQQIAELQARDLDWIAQTLPVLDMETDGTPKENGLQISLMRRSETGLVTINFTHARNLRIRGATTTFDDNISVNKKNKKLKGRLEDSLAKAIVNPFELKN